MKPEEAVIAYLDAIAYLAAIAYLDAIAYLAAIAYLDAIAYLAADQFHPSHWLDAQASQISKP